jgi:pimeloyl-ACP methyl ester carboxylesterase
MPTLELDGRRLHYLDEGGGEPVLLLVHGFPFSARMWEPQIAAFSDRHRVVAPDLSGFGESEVPPERSAYSIDGYADEVAGVVAALGLGRVVLAGLSMGGYIALALARRHPQILAGLVLADTRAEADSQEVKSRRSDQQVFLSARKDIAPLVDGLLENLLSKRGPAREEVADRAGALMRTVDPDGWIGALEAMKQRSDASPGLAGITVPTLVLVGEDDEITPPSAAEAMAEAIPGARLVVVPAAGHLTNLENPEAFNEAVGGFLASL